MEIEEQNKLSALLRQNSANAERYLEIRKKSAQAKYQIDVIIASKYLSKEINIKCAYEKAIIVCMENDAGRLLYKEYLDSTAEYKGLEKVIEANADQIRWAQSRMKYILQNE